MVVDRSPSPTKQKFIFIANYPVTLYLLLTPRRPLQQTQMSVFQARLSVLLLKRKWTNYKALAWIIYAVVS